MDSLRTFICYGCRLGDPCKLIVIGGKTPTYCPYSSLELASWEEVESE